MKINWSKFRNQIRLGRIDYEEFESNGMNGWILDNIWINIFKILLHITLRSCSIMNLLNHLINSFVYSYLLGFILCINLNISSAYSQLFEIIKFDLYIILMDLTICNWRCWFLPFYIFSITYINPLKWNNQIFLAIVYYLYTYYFFDLLIFLL